MPVFEMQQKAMKIWLPHDTTHTLTKHLQHQATQSQWVEKNCLGTPKCYNLRRRTCLTFIFDRFATFSGDRCTGGEKGTNMLHLSRKVSADAAPLLSLPTQNDVLHPQMLPLPPKKCAGRSMSPTTHEFQTLRLPRIPDSWRSYSTACRRSFATAFRRSFSTPLPSIYPFGYANRSMGGWGTGITKTSICWWLNPLLR